MSAEKERPHGSEVSSSAPLLSATKTAKSNPSSAMADRHISPFIRQSVQSSSIKKPILKSGGSIGSAMKPSLSAAGE